MLINSGNISNGKDSSTLSNEIDKLNEQIAGITEENDKIRSSYTECKNTFRQPRMSCSIENRSLAI